MKYRKNVREVEVMGKAKGKELEIGNWELGGLRDKRLEREKEEELGNRNLELGKKSRKKFVRSVEYEVLSNLIMQNYLVDGKPDFERLLSIPEDSRIPGLMKEFGIRRVYQMIVLIVREFCYGTGLAKSKVLTETRMKVCACDILLFAEEENMSLEDMIILFEAKRQKRRKEIKEITHDGVMETMREYVRMRDLELGSKDDEDKVKRIGEVRTIGNILKDEFGGFEPAA